MKTVLFYLAKKLILFPLQIFLCLSVLLCFAMVIILPLFALLLLLTWQTPGIAPAELAITAFGFGSFVVLNE